MTALQVIWFLLIGVLLTGFAVLDGFDLGVGIWHLKSKGDDERRTLLNAVGPLWDGNEVWLLTGGGAIFAAFPPVYASVFSGFYLAMMLLVLCLVARAVSLEFRSKEESPTWRSIFDGAFSIGSMVASVLFGTALGNVLRGIPLNPKGDYTAGFFDLLNPYALLIGLTGFTMIAFHGANFIMLKTPGDLAKRALSWSRVSGIAFVALFVVASVWSLAAMPHLSRNFFESPVLFAIPLIGLAASILSMTFGKRGRAGKALVLSGVAVAAMMGITGASLYPNMVPALNDPALSLTIFNSSSSQNTLTAMFVLALIGMPFVLGYTIWVYRKFGGKVDINSPANHY